MTLQEAALFGHGREEFAYDEEDPLAPAQAAAVIKAAHKAIFLNKSNLVFMTVLLDHG
jgi:hypothetical protein